MVEGLPDELLHKTATQSVGDVWLALFDPRHLLKRKAISALSEMERDMVEIPFVDLSQSVRPKGEGGDD